MKDKRIIFNITLILSEMNQINKIKFHLPLSFYFQYNILVYIITYYKIALFEVIRDYISIVLIGIYSD